ncbi:hypothetical protein MKW98_030790 [Papaver atlanticum]|uniref:Uncharacterized protein n=1 Tax=Papaver atlanticum TaxID=357466 RepID=A0AAD4X5Q5_9MAGN|nr:hypothetical protein MKW98_030790 [Papaver atlanticum]
MKKEFSRMAKAAANQVADYFYRRDLIVQLLQVELCAQESQGCQEFSRMAKAAANQAANNFYRRDMKSAALARLRAVHRSLKVAKPGVKNSNRQTSKKSNRSPKLSEQQHKEEEKLKTNHFLNKMTTVPGSLIWEIMKRNNGFLVKEFGNGNQMVQFSKEPNNLYNVNSKVQTLWLPITSTKGT